MSIIRLIHIKIDPSETETAERIWKTECANPDDFAEGLHLREAVACARTRRVHFLFRMGDGGRHRALHEQRSPQADRQPHAQREGRQRRGQAV
jgi:hypothetical protein